MKRIFSFIILIIATGYTAYGQLNNPLTQYNQLPYLQNAALSGVTGSTDIKAGFKKQWATFRGAPQTYLLGVNHVFNKGAATTDSISQPQQGIKVGVSGYLMENSYNYIKDTQLGLSCAVHVPVLPGYYLSAGLSAGYERSKADMEDVVIRDMQDPFYLSLLASNGAISYLNIDAGLVLYSDRLYLGYSIQRLSRKRFDSDIPEDQKSNMRHTVLAGYTISLNENFEFQPGLLFRYESALKDIYNVSAKFRYNATLLGGLAYSPGESLSLLTGYRLNDYLMISYSYDFSLGKTSSVSQGSHEVIVGISPFRKGMGRSAFW